MTWVKASLAANVCWVNWRCVRTRVFFGCQHVWRPAYIIHLRACVCVYVCVHMCTSSHECVSCVFVSQPRPAEVTLKAMGTDITAGGRGVSGQTAGFPITLGLVLRPLPLNSSLEARRGQQRSNTLLPPPLSFHHLPRPLSADNNFLLFLTLCASFRPPHPSSLSSCVTLPLWFSHIFAPHLFPSLLSLFLAVYLSLFFFLALFIALRHFQFPSVIFPSRIQENSGVPTFCWVGSWSRDCNRDTMLPPLPPHTQADYRVNRTL